MEETQLQVTERIERKLQETRHLDTCAATRVPGFTTIFVDLQGSTPPAEVPDVWYEVRKNIGDIRQTLPQGVIGPGFNDDFGDTFGIIYGFTADGFTERELRDYVEAAARGCCWCPTCRRSRCSARRTSGSSSSSRPSVWPGWGSTSRHCSPRCSSRTSSGPPASSRPATERISLRVSGAFDNEADIEGVNFSVGGRMVRLGDIAKIRRGFVDPPQPMFRVNGSPAIGLAIAMRDGGDILALGENITAAMAEITRRIAASASSRRWSPTRP